MEPLYSKVNNITADTKSLLARYQHSAVVRSTHNNQLEQKSNSIPESNNPNWTNE